MVERGDRYVLRAAEGKAGQGPAGCLLLAIVSS